MANEVQSAAPVELAPDIGINNIDPATLPTQEDLYNQSFDPAAFEEAKRKQQGAEAQSLLNAVSPTPLGKPVTPSMSQTLSNLGKVEPAQVRAASIALDGKQVPQVSGSNVVSVMDKINPEQQAQGVSATSMYGQSGQYDPNQLVDSVSAAYGQQQQANRAIATATENKAKADRAQFENAEKAYGEAELKRAENKLRFDADFNGKMQDYETSLADYKQAAGEKVMPGRILADMATGQRVQAGIFMALSAYGAAISGQENQALKVINNAIDRDLEAQKFNLENKLKGARIGIEGSQYLMSQMRQKFGDDESATLASRAAMLAMTQQQLNVNASKLDRSTAGPKAQALNAQLEMQKQQVLGQLKQSQAQTYMLQKVQGSNSKNLSPAEISVMESANKGFRDRWVQGYGEATNGEQAKDFIKYSSEVGPAVKSIERIQALIKDFNNVTDLTKRKIIETELAGVIGNLRVPITGPGILTDKEREAIKNEVIGNPNQVFTLKKWQIAKLNTTYNKLASDLRERGLIAGLPSDSFKQVQSTKLFLD